MDWSVLLLISLRCHGNYFYGDRGTVHRSDSILGSDYIAILLSLNSGFKDKF